MKSLKNVVLAKSSSQPKSTYEAAESVTEFELKKILLDKMERTYSLKRDREGKHKDEDPSVRSDRGLKKRKKSKDSSQAEEPVFETTYTKMPQDKGDDMGNTEDQPNVEEASKHDWFKKPERPPTPDPDWNIDNLTLQHFVRPTFNLLKGTCKSRVELEYHFEECYKVVTYRLDWTNPEGHQYPFDLSKPLPLIEVQGRQVVPADYFINNDLEYLKGGSLSRKYTTSTTKTKAAKKRIIAITYVKVMKMYDYGYLEEIVVRRDDNTLHKFKEGNFPNLNLRDIEDMLLLLFCDGTLTSVQRVLHDIASSLEMEYFPKRTWSELDKKRSRIMIKNGEMLKDSIDNGPYQFKLEITVKDTDGVFDIHRPQRLEDLAGQDNAGNNQASGARVINTVGNAGANQPRVVRCYNCNGEDHVDAYDSDCDDKATTNAIFMANLSPVGSLNDDTVEAHYDSDILSET
ncbi:hypothetical protein Tco_1133817 [Tanacetum coccineum]